MSHGLLRLLIYYRVYLIVLDHPSVRKTMKILSIPTLGILSLTLAGCIGKEQPFDIDPAICDHHPGEYGCPAADSSESSTPVAVSSSSTPVVVSSSSAPVVVSSSSAPVVVSSSSAPVVVISSSSTPLVSSSSAPAVSSSSAPAVNIEDLSFSAGLKEDKSIQTDSVENLGSALLELIDKQAFDDFYLSLVAQGLDKDAIAKAVSVLGPVGSAIAADFIKAFSGQDLLPAPEGINLLSSVTPVGSRGVEYSYAVNQTIDGVDVKLDLALRFETQAPTLSALIGRSGYNVYLDGLKLIVNEMVLNTSEVTITLDTTESLLASGGLLDAQVGLTEDGSDITTVAFNGETITLNLQGNVVNGIIGVTASGSGTIEGVNATLDLQNDSSSINVTQPDVEVNMQGVDTSN